MAWKGSGDDQTIWWSRLHGSSLAAGGAVWSPPAPTNFKTSTFPALGQLGDRTFMVFRREEPDPTHPDRQQYSIRWAELHGDQWQAESDNLLLNYVDENVSLAQHDADERLHMVWRRTFDSRICWAIFDGTGFDHQGPIKDWTTSAVPAVASDGVTLHFAWRRVEDDHIGWSIRIGDYLRDERILDDRRTSGAPALGRSDRGEAVMVWRGAADSVLWWSRYSALEWDPQYYPFADRQTDVWHGVGLA